MVLCCRIYSTNFARPEENRNKGVKCRFFYLLNRAVLTDLFHKYLQSGEKIAKVELSAAPTTIDNTQVTTSTEQGTTSLA